jgi:hypothetical protein
MTVSSTNLIDAEAVIAPSKAQLNAASRATLFSTLQSIKPESAIAFPPRPSLARIMYCDAHACAAQYVLRLE